MEDTIINGVSINALKKQRESLRQGATKFISDTIDEATKYVQEILDINKAAEDDDEYVIDFERVEELAKKATELLEAADLVADVANVEYCIAYNEPYDSGNAMSDRLEYCESFNLWEDGKNKELKALYAQLQDMEHKAYLWNSSSVDC